jgi:MFS family permease
MTRRSGPLLPVLVGVTFVTATVSSLGAPLIPSIGEEMHVSLSTAQWALTATLLVGAVSSPIMGRIGDGPHQRAALLGGLLAVAVGGAVSALAPSLPVLVAGRALQGLALGLVPVAMATAREHLPADKVTPAIALLSVSAAGGVGAGYPVAGLIADGLGLSAAFWFGAAVSFMALAAAAAVVPPSAGRATGPLDLGGSLLLTGGLGALLLAIAEGTTWGWTSPAEIGLAVAAVVLLGAWVLHQLRSPAPLVELRLLRHPAVLTGDVCAVVLGVAMYMFMSLVTEHVQTPPSAGYGFGASVFVAGLTLAPFSALTLVVARAVPALTRLVGERAVLPLGCVVVGLAGGYYAVFHDALWQAFVALAIVGVGIGATFAVIPGLIVRAVPSSETGSAMGFYQVVRYVGFSLGSALAASLLAAHTPAGAHLPTANAFPQALWVAAAICLLAGAAAWLLPPAPPGPVDPALARLGEEDAELGGAGLVGIDRP